MLNAAYNLEPPGNEPVREYRPGAPETASLREKLDEMAANPTEIPCIVDGEAVTTGKVHELTAPHDHGLVVARWHAVTQEVLQRAHDASLRAWADWSQTAPHARLSIFKRAAELLAGPWRDTLNAATMLGQSKTCHQAEIDAACELIDFWRFNPYYAMAVVYGEQPRSSTGVWNYVDHRPLEGFVYAVTPFNFTCIGGNLPTAPAMMGNVCQWKPSRASLLSNYYIMRVLMEAGLPPGVINFLPGSGKMMTDLFVRSEHFSGLHYTGSTEVFQNLWQEISGNLTGYRSYPRIVGETGGKDFIFVHESADLEAAVAASVRGAFEYQGQKCSAVSRLYVPRNRWPEFRDRLVAEIETIKVGDVRDFENFMGAVINEEAFEGIGGYIEHAKSASGAKLLTGGETSSADGWFIPPTVIECSDPRFKTMREEIFGPVLSVHAYDETDMEGALDLCDVTSPYALTGAVFANDRGVIERVAERLRYTAGNFYINDKPTGAIVGQQPFGGARASGTDDKAGSPLNLVRWVAPRAIKEAFVPPRDYRYPFLG